ncbi:MAG: hypothetical protein CBE21_07365 [Proteobacteria bacterium TMED261]|nr:MAG: hypothetical protein CBE21_07365 [Proteobacteria bacterium TMED261]
MIALILIVCVVYLIQLILPGFLARSEPAALSTRAVRATHNLRESLPVFFVLAIVSDYKNLETNLVWAQVWLVLRIAFLIVYVMGINLKPVDEFGYQAQPVRSLLWVLSILCLIGMAVNIAVS